MEKEYLKSSLAKHLAGEDEIFLRPFPEIASALHVALDRLSRLLQADFSDFLKYTGNLRLAEWRVLVVLSESEFMMQRDIVKAVVIEQAQVSRALSSMQDNGLIEAQRSESDKRAWKFGLTQKGRELFHKIQPLAIARRDRLDSALDEDTAALFFQALVKIAQVCRSTPDNATKTSLSETQ